MTQVSRRVTHVMSREHVMSHELHIISHELHMMMHEPHIRFFCMYLGVSRTTAYFTVVNKSFVPHKVRPWLIVSDVTHVYRSVWRYCLGRATFAQWVSNVYVYTRVWVYGCVWRYCFSRATLTQQVSCVYVCVRVCGCIGVCMYMYILADVLIHTYVHT